MKKFWQLTSDIHSHSSSFLFHPWSPSHASNSALISSAFHSVAKIIPIWIRTDLPLLRSPQGTLAWSPWLYSCHDTTPLFCSKSRNHSGLSSLLCGLSLDLHLLLQAEMPSPGSWKVSDQTIILCLLKETLLEPFWTKRKPGSSPAPPFPALLGFYHSNYSVPCIVAEFLPQCGCQMRMWCSCVHGYIMEPSAVPILSKYPICNE